MAPTVPHSSIWCQPVPIGVEELTCSPETSDLIHSTPVLFTNTRATFPLAAVLSRSRVT